MTRWPRRRYGWYGFWYIGGGYERFGRLLAEHIWNGGHVGARQYHGTRQEENRPRRGILPRNHKTLSHAAVSGFGTGTKIAPLVEIVLFEPCELITCTPEAERAIAALPSW